MIKFLKRIALTVLVLSALLAIVAFFYMRQTKFGKAPAGERLSRIQKSPNFKNGQFQNLSPTLELAEGYNIVGVTYAQLFRKALRRTPVDSLPSVKTDLLHLPP